MNTYSLKPNVRWRVCALAWIALSATCAHAAPVFEYRFPASWDGVAATITDLSGVGNDAVPTGAPILSANVPPGAPLGTQSANAAGGGIRTVNTALLNNPVIAAAGGFRFDATIYWDGTNNSFGIQKIIDYAGTEYLQLQDINVSNGTAVLRMGFNDDPQVCRNLIFRIHANQWYQVSGIFDTQGNSVAADGSLSGTAMLIVDGQTSTDIVSKTMFGDSLNRRIGLGNFSNSSGALIEFHGDIFRASVRLIPEPATGHFAIFAAAIASFTRRRLL